MNTSKNCLNCGTEVSLNFCPKCGQKTTIHRYSFAHFVEHDLVHGIWHLDKGILFTIKKLLLQPGHSIREFLQGKRVNYFNVITLLILIMGLSYFLNEASPIKITDLFRDEETKKAMSSIEKFSKEYPKLQLLLFIPVYSLFSFLWFRKAKLNFVEHFILNAYLISGVFLLTLIFSFATFIFSSIPILQIIFLLTQILAIAYTIWFYYQFFSAYSYSKIALFARSLAVIISVYFFYSMIGFMIGMMKLI